MTKKLNPLEEASQYYWQNFREVMRTRASRRVVIKAGTLAALGGAAVLSEILAACNRRPTETAKPGVSTSVAGAPTTTSAATSEDPFKGLKYAADVVKVGELPKGKYKYSRFPLVEFYNWRKLPWDKPLYRGGTFMRSGSSPVHWDLMNLSTGIAHQYHTNALLRPIMGAGVDLDFQPLDLDLAEKMDHTPDYSSWTFKIPQGVKFHDIAPVNGRECTAEDVVYSFQRHMDTNIFGVSLGFVDKVSAPDKYTVRFDMKKPITHLPAILALPYFMVFAKEHFEGDKDFWKSQPIGTGPFKVISSKYRDNLISERNPSYFKKDKSGNQLPYVDKIVGNYYADAATVKAAFRSGNLDELHHEPMSIEYVDDILKSNPDILVSVIPQWVCGYTQRLFFQQKNKMFSDVRVRRALSMAIDRRGVVKNALGGAGTPAARAIPFDQEGLKEVPDLEELGPYYQYNPTEAKKLLTEAGYPNGFSTKLAVNTGGVLETHLLIQKYWKDVGVKLDFEENDYLLNLAKMNKKEHTDLFLPGGVLGFDPDPVARPQFYPNEPNNWGNVDDPTLTDLLDKLRDSLNPDERTKLAHQINLRIEDQVHHLYVVGYHAVHFCQPWTSPIADSTYTTIANWGNSNYVAVFVNDAAPSGRGGKKV